MLGLIKKDLYMIKSNLKVIVLILIVFAFMSIQEESGLAFVPALTSVMVFISTFSYDEYNKFDAYAISFPNGRKNVVKAKYLASLILIVISTLLTVMLSFIITSINHTIDYEYLLGSAVGCIFACILILSIIVPLIIKFGVEKGRISLFIGAFAFSAIITLVAKTGCIKLSEHALSNVESYLPLILVITSILLLSISFFISNKVYSKKEF